MLNPGALFQFRSPLLSESRLISLPAGTEMFHFPAFAPLCGDTTRAVPGCPIQKSPDQSFLAAPRGFSQPSTSFIASTSLGIHLWPLISFYSMRFTTLFNVLSLIHTNKTDEFVYCSYLVFNYISIIKVVDFNNCNLMNIKFILYWWRIAGSNR